MLTTGSPRRALAVMVTALAAAVVATGPWSAGASPGIPIATSTTTTEAPPEESTTTTTSDDTPSTTTSSTLLPQQSSTTTTTTPDGGDPTSPLPPGDDDGGGGGDPGADPPAAPPEAGDGGVAPTDAGPFPAELRALMNSVPRTGSNNTKKLMFALSPLLQYGLTEVQAAVVGFGRFPVAGVASYSHDWWFPRFGPGWRLHEGTDIFAAHGTPVRAPVDGRIKITNGGLGGLSVYVIQPDGTYWYLTHLAALPEGLVEGATVKTGQVIGFVGDSGNAKGGPPHLHFEIHPGGGGAIDPKSVLDQFIADALTLAPQVVDAYARAAPGTQPSQIVLPTPAPQPVAAALPPRAALLWSTAVSPTGGVAHLVEEEAVRVASSIDWSSRERNLGPTDFDRRIARQYATWWLQAFVHPALARRLNA